MSIIKSLSFDEICQRGIIHATDVQRLRSLFYDDAHISREEAEALFALNEACQADGDEWPQFFVEAVTDYIVNEVEPRGYLTSANADWIIERISKDGIINSRTELELLINVIDKARWSPERLVKFVLEQVESAVLDGAGPLRTGPHLEAGRVTDDDVDMLRRALYAFGGDGNIAITRTEAEVLFRINDGTAHADNSDHWQELFVKAIANTIMAASGYKMPSREEALRREKWLESRGDLSVGAFLSSIATGGISGIREAYFGQSAEERAIARLEQQRVEIITNEAVTGGEVDWLAEQIGRDGALTENEKALLAFVKAESPTLHPSLQPLLGRIDEAA